LTFQSSFSSLPSVILPCVRECVSVCGVCGVPYPHVFPLPSIIIVCGWVCVCVAHTHTHTPTCDDLSVSLLLHSLSDVCVREFGCVGVWVWVYVCLYVCVCVCMYILVCVSITLYLAQSRIFNPCSLAMYMFVCMSIMLYLHLLLRYILLYPYL